MRETAATIIDKAGNRNATRPESRVLIIEDDLSYIFLCKRYLRADDTYDHKVVSASNAREAMTICSLERFDCIVADYMLPDKLGTEAIEDLNDLLGVSMPPSIIFTADGGEKAAGDAVRSGAIDFLAKRNVNQESLCRAVNNAVEKGTLRQSLTCRIRELETANELLIRRNNEIQRFYHTVSHEVKTPLTAIQEFVSIVHDGVAGELQEEQKTILNYALQSCEQISTHFNDLLELSRFETGKMTVDLAPNSIYDVFNHCVVAARPAAIAKDISLEVTDQDDLPLVLIQSNRIIQVVSNLLGNAIKFTDSGGTVKLDCLVSENGKSLKISVSDTGCGISESDLPHIFDRLYQVMPTERRDLEPGMGLGLSIASQIIELHGSEIMVESTLDQGTIFSFELETCVAADSEQAA